MKGTRPQGTETGEQAAHWVRNMFGRVAHRYDLANHLLSLGIDRSWRRRTVKRIHELLINPEARVADLCCGTGDLALALSSARGSAVLASDFCGPMLERAFRKLGKNGFRPVLFEADALQLPFAEASLDLITCAFGLRNLADYDAGLHEFRRVLRPGGQVAILEFSHPPNRVFRAFYEWYSKVILPRAGGLLSGARDAYSYLPESVKKFPDAEELAARMHAAGFARVEFERMTFGVVALHIGRV